MRPSGPSASPLLLDVLMTRQRAVQRLNEIEEINEANHARMKDFWYTHPMQHALKAEASALRNNLHRLPLANPSSTALTPAAARDRIAKIRERLDYMSDTLSGCDWCCYGGDQEWEKLNVEAFGILKWYPKLAGFFYGEPLTRALADRIFRSLQGIEGAAADAERDFLFANLRSLPR